MKKTLPKRKMIRYCLSDVAKGLFNGMIGNHAVPPVCPGGGFVPGSGED